MEPEKNESHTSDIIASFVTLAIIVMIILFAFTNTSLLSSFFKLGNTSSTFPINNSYTAGIDSCSQSSSPTINNSATFGIGYPSDYGVLANFTLELINNDRASANLTPVTLSPIQSGQQHADSMLCYGYFSHWDTQGYKPYMRYSLLNGTGAVEENVAFEETTYASFYNTERIEQALSTLEYQMMNNDTICCNNGHRDNILSPYHNRVSIGIAYDVTHVYFVEDFENYYIQLSTPIFSASNASVRIVGNSTQGINPSSVQVFFDNTPTPLSPALLNSQYQKPYDQGTFAGGVMPCDLFSCFSFQRGITVRPSVWVVSNSSVDIVFSLGNFIKDHGSGVYTIYTTQGSINSSEYLTSISIVIQT